MVKAVNCHICRQPFIARSPNAKYCPGCQKEAKRRSDAEHEKRRSAKRAALRNGTKIKNAAPQNPAPKPRKQTPTIKTVDEYCIGCTYLIRAGEGSLKACYYIGAIGKRRPCPAGKGCTVRKEVDL